LPTTPAGGGSRKNHPPVLKKEKEIGENSSLTRKKKKSLWERKMAKALPRERGIEKDPGKRTQKRRPRTSRKGGFSQNSNPPSEPEKRGTNGGKRHQVLGVS